MNDTIDGIVDIIENGFITEEFENSRSYNLGTLLSSFIASFTIFSLCLGLYFVLRTRLPSI